MKYIATLFFLCCCFNARSQSSPNDYVFSTNANATLYNMNNADTLIGGGQDNITDDARLLPFTFAFLGEVHLTFSVGTQGIVYLSPQGGNNNYYQIVPLRADGNSSNYKWSGTGMGTSKSGAIVCKTFGAEPNRQFIISFEKMSLSKRTGNEDATFQVALHESSGVVQFIYGTVNVSDTLQGVYDPMIRKTSINQNLEINPSSHTAFYSTSSPSNYIVNPGTMAGLHSPVNGSSRTYLFTPPSIPNYVDTNLVFNPAVSGVVWMNIPEYNPSYSYYYRVSNTASGPYSMDMLLTSNQIAGTPDSTFYYRLYRTNGGAIAANFASGAVTYGSPRKFISQNSGF